MFIIDFAMPSLDIDFYVYIALSICTYVSIFLTLNFCTPQDNDGH